MQRRLPPPPQPHTWPCSRRGRIPRRACGARNAHSTALFAYECQSFLENVIAGLGLVGAWDDPRQPGFAMPASAAAIRSYGLSNLGNQAQYRDVVPIILQTITRLTSRLRIWGPEVRILPLRASPNACSRISGRLANCFFRLPNHGSTSPSTKRRSPRYRR